MTLDALLIGSFDAAASAARQPNSIGDPTDWPSWFSAVGTVGAFAVALYLLWVQINDRRKEARERVTAQARLLAAWVADIAEREHEDPSAFYAVTVRASNGSTAPVYDVAVTTDLGVRGSHERNPDVLGPHETRDFVITAPREPRGQPLAMVVRDAFLTEDGSRIELEDGSGVLLLENYVPAVSISFVDSAGRRWIRQPKGELQPLGI